MALDLTTAALLKQMTEAGGPALHELPVEQARTVIKELGDTTGITSTWALVGAGTAGGSAHGAHSRKSCTGGSLYAEQGFHCSCCQTIHVVETKVFTRMYSQ